MILNSPNPWGISSWNLHHIVLNLSNNISLKGLQSRSYEFLETIISVKQPCGALK